MAEKSNDEKNLHSDDEFHDAVGQANEQVIDQLVNSQQNMYLEDDECSSIPPTIDSAENDPPDVFKECEEIIVDEEALLDLEKDMSEEDKLSNKNKAEGLKVEGNDLFKLQEYEKSIEVYTKALGIAPASYPNERAVLYANRAAAKIKLNFKNPAIEDCTQAIKLNPQYTKAYLRRAKLWEETEKLDESLEDYKKIIELEPSCGEALSALQRLPPLIQERNEKLKDEMLGKLKDLGNMILKPFGLSTNNFQMQQDPSTGSYSINFQQNT